MKRVKNGKEFKQAMLKGSEITEDKVIEILQKLSVDAFAELVRRSAKDTGYLRSNWDISVDRYPPEERLENPYTDKKYSPASYSNPIIEADSRIVLYNNTAYAIYLELGTAHMRAQPMVQPTYEYVSRVAAQLAKNLSKEKLDV